VGGRLEEAEGEADVGDQFEAVAQHPQRATLLQRLFELAKELRLGTGAIVGLELLPLLRLGRLQEAQQRLAIQRQLPVEGLSRPHLIALLRDQAGKKVVLQNDFPMDGAGASCRHLPFPVTAPARGRPLLTSPPQPPPGLAPRSSPPRSAPAAGQSPHAGPKW